LNQVKSRIQDKRSTSSSSDGETGRILDGLDFENGSALYYAKVMYNSNRYPREGLLDKYSYLQKVKKPTPRKVAKAIVRKNRAEIIKLHV